MTYNIVILPGDGIGREVMEQGRAVLVALADRFAFTLDLREFPCGGQHYLETGEEWPVGTFELCRDWSDAILLGAVGWPGAILPSGFNAGHNVIFDLRFGLDLYANVRPVKLLPGVSHLISGRFQQVWAPEDVDLVIVRENTEGLYAHTRSLTPNESGRQTQGLIEAQEQEQGQRQEHKPGPRQARVDAENPTSPERGNIEEQSVDERVIDERVITTRGSERIARFAFELVRERGHHLRLTCVDKSNVLSGCRLFRTCFDRIGQAFPDIQRDHVYIDAFCQSLMREPQRYDVVVTTNLFGDIATDLAAVLQGGMGMAASFNQGPDHILFEPVHGTAPDQAGKDTANPMAMLLSVKLMLQHWARINGDRGAEQATQALKEALTKVLAQPDLRTPDLGGNGRCSHFGQAVVSEIEQA